MAERMAEWAAAAAGRDPLSAAKGASDLGLYESRLSESNRRPIHYEVHPYRPRECVGVRSCRPAAMSIPSASAHVHCHLCAWPTGWLSEPTRGSEPASR
jgi:hypothetical protein